MTQDGPSDATIAQIRAARPAESTWLSANAGSGKTRVLTDRVARLLLAQVQPERILCLTYTKAAASEMQNRLFQRLGGWAMLPDDALRSALQDLGADGNLNTTDLRRARTLFTAAIEAPGGLKIQTIHSFCSSILRRFPLEAGVSPQFTEIEDRAAALLRDEIIEDMAQGPAAHLITDLARLAAVHDLTELTGEIVGAREFVTGPTSETQVRAQFGLDDETSLPSLLKDLMDPATKSLLKTVATILSGQSASYQRHAELLTALDMDTPSEADLDTLISILFYTDGRGAKIGSYPQSNHKKVREAVGEHLPALDGLMERLEHVVLARNALKQVGTTVALNAFAHAFLSAYDMRKQTLGWLDFDDLILKTRDLLHDPKVAQWVLYRLDGGIDHILVDEAQDTSPEQWDVIERLSEDFTSGEGTRADVPRTLFVVGDKKQSIYSFQGADPREFDSMRDKFQTRLADTNTPLVPAELKYSFRSANCILALVDKVFAGRTDAGFPNEANHIAFHDTMPGRVDIWPNIETKKASSRGKPEDRGEFTETTDKLAEDHNHVLLARRIASEIRRMIGGAGTRPDVIHGDHGPRAVTAGDVLILVQQRGTLFEEIIRACKAEELPIAGADRLKVAAELAVRDIRALLSFVATQEDDYSLAVALKSPLFGWSEKALFDLAQPRKGYLWEHLRNQEAHSDDIAILQDLRDNADFLRPYELIERVLTRHKGRQRLIGRLGAEAEDGIDALLSQALSYERSQTPSLTGFLTWMETDDLTIKRQMALVRDEIRVMTVHGAKGLEAPIVILPDTAKKKPRSRGSIMGLRDMLTWNAANDTAPSVVRDAKEAAATRGAEERMRLLYVAMTRAEKWLILASSGELGDAPDDSWYNRVRTCAEDMAHVPFDYSFGQGLRIEPLPWGALPDTDEDAKKRAVMPALEPFFSTPAPSATIQLGPLSPSTDLGGAKALPSDQGHDEDIAKERGTQIHMLLEHFAAAPRDKWDQLAHMLLPGAPNIDDLIAEASRVLTAPHLAFVFAPNTLSEVAVSAPLPELAGRSIDGIIDRLVPDDPIWIIDFKTNAAIPDTALKCPEGLLRQMGAYRAAIAQIYPEKTIKTAIVWTRDASLMELPETLTSDALHRASATLTH